MVKSDSVNIVVVGYPKSGTTWASRLVAELLKCPFYANWGFDNTKDHFLVEGQERISRYICYKSHHSYENLFSCWDLKPNKIVYVIRDPRDIVISGMYFFDSFFGKTLRPNLLKKIFLKSSLGKKYLQKRMTQAVLQGDEKISEWLVNPWSEHVKEYENKPELLLIKYEDLLEEELKTSKKILDFIGEDVVESEIFASIEKQSFENRRLEANSKKNKADLKLLRLGNSSAWKKELNKEYANIIENENEIVLRRYDYL